MCLQNQYTSSRIEGGGAMWHKTKGGLLGKKEGNKRGGEETGSYYLKWGVQFPIAI